MNLKRIRSLVVYYSLEEDIRTLAESISQETNSEICELKPIISRGKGKDYVFIWGKNEIAMKFEPELEPLDKIPEEYDLIFIGTPVWELTFAPPLRSFLRKFVLQGKKVALFCSHEGEIGTVFEDLKKELQGAEVVGQMDFFDPLRSDINGISKEIEKWSQAILDKI